MKITSFTGEYSFLSNFHPSKIEYCGVIYPTLEHAYQAAKTDNPEERKKIQAADTPGKAKKLGKSVTLTRDWNRKKLIVMENMLRQKFYNKELRKKLLATGTAQLIEGNNWGDTFWGICNGKGMNHLGNLLVEIRADLKEYEDGELK